MKTPATTLAPIPARLAPFAIAFACALLMPGCAAIEYLGFAPNRPDAEAVKTGAPMSTEPDRVTVRHVLISYDGAKTRGVTRTLAEAEQLAAKVLALAKGGRDFAELVRLYSDDRHGEGSYTLVNWGVVAAATEVSRLEMVRGFGDAAFSSAVGQVVLVPYDKEAAPYGYHIVRRDR